MKIYILLFVSLFSFLASSCNEKKQKLSFYEDEKYDSNSSEFDENEEDDYNYNQRNVSVPFTEKGGVKYIEVKLNGVIGIDMILDSGCSITSISKDEAQYLYSKGVLSKDDFIGTKESVIADGSIVEDMVVNIRELVIGDVIKCKNIEAMVSSNSQVPLLLGNEVLDRVTSYTVDNENKKINFLLK